MRITTFRFTSIINNLIHRRYACNLKTRLKAETDVHENYLHPRGDLYKLVPILKCLFCRNEIIKTSIDKFYRRYNQNDLMQRRFGFYDNFTHLQLCALFGQFSRKAGGFSFELSCGKLVRARSFFVLYYIQHIIISFNCLRWA